MEMPKKTVEDWLKEVDYSEDLLYVPSLFALNFINFIKLVNGGEGEENKTPIIHFKMLDKILSKNRDTCNLCARGMAKTTLFGEYLILYIATYGGIDGFGKIPLGIYVSDSIDNGVKNMRKNLEHRWENSDFLKQYIPKIRFTDIRWEFENVSGKVTIFKGYGAKTGVRGAKELGQRPNIAILDDLLSDEDARSATVIASIEDTVYKAIDYALHPKKRKIIWSGTPFNKADPLYKAVESGAWEVNVFPICEQYPCTREEFKGAWEERFDYDYVQRMYNKAFASGKIDAFNQELMLRILSDEDRLVKLSDLVFFDRDIVIKNKHNYNFYITTDLATSESQRADYSVILVWAYSANGDWLLVDGVCKRQLVHESIKDIFRFVVMYKPQQVGMEVSGQQKGFISWIKQEMLTRRIFFTLASDKATGEEGLRPTTSKLVRFNSVLPLFKMHKIWVANQLKDESLGKEFIDEITSITSGGYKSKHDDVGDATAQIMLLDSWQPFDILDSSVNEDLGIFPDEEIENSSRQSSYIV